MRARMRRMRLSGAKKRSNGLEALEDEEGI